MSSRALLGFPAGAPERRLVGALAGTTILLWLGASAILPLLPVYLRREGSSTALVGIVMASYFAASVLTQYPVGRLSDRVGRRPVVVGGLAVFALGSVGFALFSSPGPAIAFRSLQGVGAGAVTVAAAAAIGTLVPAGERGAAFGALYGSQMLALALGPLVGSIVGGTSMRILFLAAAAAALAAGAPVLAVLPRGQETLAGDRRRSPRRHRVLRSRPALGVLVAFAVSGAFAGMYETCWTLLLRLRHAADYQIGLSWTLFALPYALLSVPAGRLATRADRRLLAVGAIVWTAGFCLSYPLLPGGWLLVALGCLEAVGSVVGTAPALLVLTEHTPPGYQGAAQGAVETARTATTAASAAVAGALFGVAPLVPFAVASAVGLAGALAVVLLWHSLPPPLALSPVAAELLAAERGSGAPDAPARGPGPPDR